MKVLLVYPRFPDTSFWKFKYALHFIGKKASLPPLGLLTVAALLPEDWDVKLIDMNIHELGDHDILWADYVFISAMSVQKQYSEKVIDRCSRLGAKTVVGGPLFSAYPEQFANVTHKVLNEAEVTIPLFLEDLGRGAAQSTYCSSCLADMAQSPVPRWNLVQFKHYASMCIQYSRGCPYSCDFCDITVQFGKEQRSKTADAVIAELDALYARGWRGNVFFVDDNLIGNRRKLKHEVLPAIIGWMEIHNYPFRFQTQASIDLAEDDELLSMMTKAGFEAVFIGIESPDTDSLTECGKLQNTKRDLLESIRKIQNAGMQVQGGFIVGFDCDRETIFERMSAFINESGIVTSMVGLLNAPTGSKLYKRLHREGRIIREASGDNTDFSMNFIPKMDRGILIDGYSKIIHDIYNPEAFYARLKTFLRNYRCANKFEFRRRFSLESIRALFLTFFNLGIRPGLRRQFWDVIFWTIIKRPRSFPIAINLCIYSYQFLHYYNIRV